ncbi:MAG: methyltransferase domain-containing protein [Desulfosarcinaceae bacterium]|nr:methyltransferase domain-containing protein [Desulfosarcinaceae bacterium]
MPAWFENPEFWRAHFSRLFTQERLESADGEIAAIEKLVGLRPPAQVLDLCCGPGRHSVALACRGYAVTGVDLTAEYLAQAAQRAEAAGVTPQFLQRDMRSFRMADGFHLAINLFTSFGYFRAIADDAKVLSNVFRSLKSGGVFVMDLMGKEILARCFRERDWMESNGTLLLEERIVDEDWSWITNRCTFIDDDGRRDFSFSHRIYSAQELRSALLQAGFARVSIYGDLHGAPYDHRAQRLIAVAHT